MRMGQYHHIIFAAFLCASAYSAIVNAKTKNMTIIVKSNRTVSDSSDHDTVELQKLKSANTEFDLKLTTHKNHLRLQKKLSGTQNMERGLWNPATLPDQAGLQNEPHEFHQFEVFGVGAKDLDKEDEFKKRSQQRSNRSRSKTSLIFPSSATKNSPRARGQGGSDVTSQLRNSTHETPLLFSSSVRENRNSGQKTRAPRNPNGTYCFQRKCICYGIIADCSQNYGNLPAIPKLPQNVRFVNFTFNNLTGIQDENFFFNVPQITGIDLSYNGLAFLTETAFTNVRLTKLIVRDHKLNYTGLGPVFAVSSLRYLDVGGNVNLGPVPEGLFSSHSLPNLSTLCLNDSGIYALNMSVFQALPNLVELHLGGNELASAHFFHTARLPKLKVLVLSRNGLFHFPDTCVTITSRSSGTYINDVNSNRTSTYNTTGNAFKPSGSSSGSREEGLIPIVSRPTTTTTTTTGTELIHKEQTKKDDGDEDKKEVKMNNEKEENEEEEDEEDMVKENQQKGVIVENKEGKSSMPEKDEDEDKDKDKNENESKREEKDGKTKKGDEDVENKNGKEDENVEEKKEISGVAREEDEKEEPQLLQQHQEEDTAAVKEGWKKDTAMKEKEDNKGVAEEEIEQRQQQQHQVEKGVNRSWAEDAPINANNNNNNNNNDSLFPELAELYMKNNLLSSLQPRICLPKLRTLVLSRNMFENLPTGMFSNDRFPRLEELYLDSMSVQIAIIDRNAFSNRALRNLSLMYNNIDFSLSPIHRDSFAGLPNLFFLQIGHNYVNNVTSQHFLALFGGLTSLRRLSVGVALANNVTREMFRPMKQLLELMFYDNQITSLPDGFVDDLHRLQYLYLGGNSFASITEKTFSEETLKRLRKVDLSGDQFQCDCDLMWFRNWLVREPHKLKSLYYTYDCKNLPGIQVQDFYLDPQACMLPRVAYLFIDVSLTLILATFTLITTLFRFRWHLRLLLYEAFRGRGDLRHRRLRKGRFQYDVFVSYAKPDLPWICKHLLPELEGRLRLKLCIHERNFIVGNDIVDNIVQSVQSSKKIMMIFSKSFIRSQWCQFELNYCLRYVMDFDDALLIVRLNDVPARDMTSAMIAVMKTTTYIEWEDYPGDAVASFWGRISQALQKFTDNQIYPSEPPERDITEERNGHTLIVYSLSQLGLKKLKPRTDVCFIT